MVCFHEFVSTNIVSLHYWLWLFFRLPWQRKSYFSIFNSLYLFPVTKIKKTYSDCANYQLIKFQVQIHTSWLSLVILKLGPPNISSSTGLMLNFASRGWERAAGGEKSPFFYSGCSPHFWRLQDQPASGAPRGAQLPGWFLQHPQSVSQTVWKTPSRWLPWGFPWCSSWFLVSVTGIPAGSFPLARLKYVSKLLHHPVGCGTPSPNVFLPWVLCLSDSLCSFWIPPSSLYLLVVKL